MKKLTYALLFMMCLLVSTSCSNGSDDDPTYNYSIAQSSSVSTTGSTAADLSAATQFQQAVLSALYQYLSFELRGTKEWCDAQAVIKFQLAVAAVQAVVKTYTNLKGSVDLVLTRLDGTTSITITKNSITFAAK